MFPAPTTTSECKHARFIQRYKQGHMTPASEGGGHILESDVGVVHESPASNPYLRPVSASKWLIGRNVGGLGRSEAGVGYVLGFLV